MSVINGITVNERQADVHKVLKQYGPLPDHALVPLAQHVVQLHQSSSGLRSRRAELTQMGLVREVATTKTASGRSARIWEAL
jgi:hypothetical protein